jgi:hypothetical protein
LSRAAHRRDRLIIGARRNTAAGRLLDAPPPIFQKRDFLDVEFI